MSPIPTVYNHFNSQMSIPTSRSNCENLNLLTKPESDNQQISNRRYTVTNLSNHCQMPSSASAMDFRPLITNGRKKLGPIPSSSSMIIIKKKSPPRFNSSVEKPIVRSIPLDLTSRHISYNVSPKLPLSLSCSSSSPSTSTSSSTNVGTVFLPIEISKSQQTYTSVYPKSLSNKNYYVQTQDQSQRPFAYSNSTYRIPLNDNLDQSTQTSFSTTNGDETCNYYRSTIMMDSNVLRLIRRYDPSNINSTGNVPRRTLETTRGLWNTIATNPSDSSPFLSRRALTTAQNDDIPFISRLQRQQAIQENEQPPIPPPPPVNYIRPILKYNSTRSRSEFIVQPHQTEPLSVDIDPYITPPPTTNESSASYQPLITTANKRVCSALSKSEWDLRLQQDQAPPVRPPSPPLTLINQQSIKDNSRKILNRSQSSGLINDVNNQDEQIDNDVSLQPTSSCIEKIKQLFVSKSSQDGTDSADNRSQKSTDKSPSIRPIHKPTTIIQDVTPNFNRKPLIRSEKTIDSPETVNRSHQMNVPMVSTEFSSDAYRFRRPNEQDSIGGIRPKNIAKVEPYQMNTNTVRPLYQSSSQNTAVPCINLNSMGNTPAHSSSSAGSLGNGMIRSSDFIRPNPVQYSKHQSSNPSPSNFPTESISHRSLPSSKSHFQDPYQTIPHNDFHSSIQQVPMNYNQYQPVQINNNRQISEMPMYPTIIEQQDNQQAQSRRRFQRRKQMKRSKSVDLYQDPSFATNNLPDLSRTPRSISRECLNNEENLSSSSSNSSLPTDMERVNRAAILRYKSLDSIAYNNRKSAINARNPSSNNRKQFCKPTEFDFDSDDSVCGIPKPRKLCTSSKSVGKPEKIYVDSSTIERNQHENTRPISVQATISSTGITNSVRKHETHTDSTPSTAAPVQIHQEKLEGEDKISFAEPQFYARTSNTPVTNRRQPSPPFETPSSTPNRPLQNSVIINPFERLRPMEISPPPTSEDISPPFPLVEQIDVSIIDQHDENNDSSASTATTTTNRSVHLPVEKQRGPSEIIRKRNSKCKVEDYKRSIQKTTTVDEEPTVEVDLTPKYFDVPIDQQNANDQRAQLSIERLNLLLSKDEEVPELDEKLSVADKRNLFETKTNTAIVERSKSFKTEQTPTITKKYANDNQRSKTENIIQTNEKETFDDDTSKLSFREKMILFNKNKPQGLTPTSSLKSNRSRLTQPITAEEVQAAANLTPPSSMKQLSDDGNEPEHILPVSKRLEQFKAIGQQIESKPIVSEQKSRPLMKYAAKKTNTDQEQRAKTVDIIRLKSDSNINKPKEINKTAESVPTKSTNRNVLSVVKSDTVSVLKPDDHLENFFIDTTKINSIDQSNIQLNTDDLNQIAEKTTRLQSQAPRVRPPRRQQQGTKNPLRQIQANIATLNEYTEVHTDVSEQELRRLKRAQIAENAGIAQEALAALTANENFAEVNLRKIDQMPLIKSAFEPYKDLMLILIKGRRYCSLRLVNPVYESINEGDCYLLLTPLKVFAWLGRHANSVEKARAHDLLDYLKQHRDFGLRNEVKYFLLDQDKDDTENDLHAEFRDILSGEIDDYKLVEDVLDDDFYEMNIIELNRVYRVENDLLIPLNDYCFRSLSIKILDPNEVFVFDFGSELYVWNGKFAEKNKRNMGLQLGQQLCNEIYDMSECIIHPFEPLNEQIKMENASRPNWTLFGKQNQNVETLLFKGKFIDWPSDFEEIKGNVESTNIINKLPATQRPLSIVETLKPADVFQMLDTIHPSVNLIVDQINLGRGRFWFDSTENIGHEIQTISVNVWLIDDNDRHELPKTSYGQFYSDDVYIIRWKYKLFPIGNQQRKVDVSRERVIYWIWQGMNANLNEKGISGLLGVFLSEDRGVHIHVNQEHEEAAFLQLFDGTMTIHIGQHKQPSASAWRLYIFLGEIDCETHWWELNVHCSNLRSRTSMLLVNTSENFMLLWHGCQTSEQQQNLAKQSAMKIRDKCPQEFHFDGINDDIEFFEMQEGDEIELFWDGINERTHQRKYFSTLAKPFQHTLPAIRIYHLSSLHGPFVAQEFVYTLRSSDSHAVFPFKQTDLYEFHQPALCLIDAGYEIFIWQGWNDQTDAELKSQLSNANLVVQTPKDIRFTTERRCAFQTAIDYYTTKTGSSTVDIPCSVVYAGLEPIDFINLFPKWNVHSKARQQNQRDGKKMNQKDSVIDLLNQLSRTQYSLDELRARPLPEGVDPSKIESYLSDSDFKNEFHMTKTEFYALPYWKQTNIKKPLGFF